MEDPIHPINWNNSPYDVVYSTLASNLSLEYTQNWQLERDRVSELPTEWWNERTVTLALVKEHQIYMARQRELMNEAIAVTEAILIGEITPSFTRSLAIETEQTSATGEPCNAV